MFRFTIREIILAMALIGALAAWWIDHHQLVKQIPIPPKMDDGILYQ
jgi:hypothetical protein